MSVVGVDYHSDLKEVQCDAAISALLDPAGGSAPFDRLGWWRGLARFAGLDPLLAVARESGAVAVLPLRREGRSLAGLANWYTFRLRPVVTPGADAPRLLGAIAADLARRAHRIDLSGLPDEDGSATLLERAFRDAGWRVAREACDTNHHLETGGRTGDEFLAGRPGPLRATLRRKGGKVACDVLTRFDAAAWADYEAIYAESWKPAEGAPAFLRAFAEAEGTAGRLRLGIARAQGRAVAAQLWTVERGVAYIHKLAHREAAQALSPGTTLSAALFRHVIDVDRVATIDFGTGDEPYKRDWMERARPRFRLTMVRAGSPRNWPFLAKHALKRLVGDARRS